MMIKAVLAALSLVGSPQDATIASAIAEFARTPTEAAFLVAWGRSESEFNDDVIAGRCRRYQCDARKRADGTIVHLARGAWQQHRNGRTQEEWDALIGPDAIREQAKAASKMTRWSLAHCKGDARCAFRLLGGLRPDRKLKGEDDRVRRFVAALGAVK